MTYYASLCAIAKDEDPYLVEWTDYHCSIGFEHIYVYDNNSDRPVRDTLRDYVCAGLVTVVDFPLEVEQQLAAYADCLAVYGTGTEWMAFVDIDEFIVPKRCDDIRDLLDNYRDYGALGVHWKVFGSNGLDRRPEGGVLDNYTRVVRDDTHIKSIVRPAVTVGVSTPHSFLYRQGWYCVNEDKVPVATFQSYHTAKRVQVNHYYFKSFEEFQQKIKRGMPTLNKNGVRRRGPEALRDFAVQALEPGRPDNAVLKLRARRKQDGPVSSNATALRLGDCLTPCAEFLETAARHLAQGNPAAAGEVLKRCLRYHDAPPVWAVAAQFCLLTGERDHCFGFLGKLLRDVNSPFRDAAYRCLADYYRTGGDTETAQNLLRSLGKC
ncbi:MAG: glycosyltransferase family 92 protein [Desulfovibrio sp.]|jgi:hypothetical protein|nr:glycosyltransferase family 92 protein [Desulfovibrio sp.]